MPYGAEPVSDNDRPRKKVHVKSSTTSRTGKVRTRLIAGVTAAAFALGGLSAVAPAAAAVEMPDVIPSIDGWVPTTGTFTAVDDIAISIATPSERLSSIAGILRDELGADYPGASVDSGSAAAGDIELRLDGDRTDLGDEGYELEVGDSIVVTAAQPAGVFYGTRTIVQMLTQQTSLPQGSLVDVPRYAERGVTVCACVINISTEFIDRLIEEMAFLKLNTMLVELKVKVDAYPETNTWSYYTKDDIRTLVEKANAYGIDVIPEINSPGHMEIWLENLPDLQLTNERTGVKDEVRMDITKDASFDFYTDLIDEYSEVFTSDYWHMGVDEYMLGSGYANYPQIKRFAEAQFGAGATENDVVAWYVNKVNDYVKSQDKTLRIWNDGVMTTNKFVLFDTDIIVEHWNPAGSAVKPQQFIDWGHQVSNITNSLYMVRGGYGVNSQRLYEQRWSPEVFYDQTVTRGSDQILGARMSIWPDGGTPNEAENTTETRMFEPLRFVAQSTWSASQPWGTFAEFRTAMDTIGRSPLWDDVDRQPVPDGTFTLAGADGEGSLAAGQAGGVTVAETGEPLSFSRTADGYYTIRSSDGRCLDLARNGTMRLDVPVEIGADIVLAACATTTLQKWQLRKVDGGFTVANAASQQFVSVSEGLSNVPVARAGTKTVADGLVVQTPADWGTTVWQVVGDVAMSATPGSINAVPGASADVAIDITNMASNALAGATVRVASTSDGWTALPASQPVPELASSDGTSITFTLNNIRAASGTGSFAFELVAADGSVITQTSVTTNNLCSTESIQPASIAAVSSEQRTGEPAPNGPAAAAIDGNPATYWHSQWSPTEAKYPHSIVVDLGEEQTVCGLWYSGRASTGTGGANGRIADYDVYTSKSVTTVDGNWGDAVASGTFQNVPDAQLAGFPAQSTRYIKLVAKSEALGNPWATIGELAAAGPVAEVPSYHPAIELSADTAPAGSDIDVIGSGFAPGETVALALEAAEITLMAAAALPTTAVADAAGGFSMAVSVPAETAPGDHRVVATGTASLAEADAPLLVTAAPSASPEPLPGDGSSGALPGEGGTQNGPGNSSETDDLPALGSELAGGIAIGLLLMVAGAVFLVLRRRAAMKA